MTKEEFDSLPGLLSSGQFRRVTGFTRHKLRELRELGLVKSYPLVSGKHTKTYAKYYKADAGRIAGFEMK